MSARIKTVLQELHKVVDPPSRGGWPNQRAIIEALDAAIRIIDKETKGCDNGFILGLHGVLELPSLMPDHSFLQGH